jgi:hypothetical protein
MVVMGAQAGEVELEQRRAAGSGGEGGGGEADSAYGGG